MSILLFYSALALFTRSPCAFEAVKSLNILQLPCRSTLQSFTSANIQKPGVSNEYLCEQWKSYMAHCDRVTGPKPVGEEVLIFDEVKGQNGVSKCFAYTGQSEMYLLYLFIDLQVCWHTRTNRIVGLAMTHDDLV